MPVRIVKRPVMVILVKVLVILVLLTILGSLFSALLFLFKDHGNADSTRMVKALTLRVVLSISLFLLLGAGFYFHILPQTGLRIVH
jgi:hypothetical protein